MPTHAVLFDIDGTLISGKGMGSLALKRAFETVFQVEAVANRDLDQFVYNGRSDPAIIAEMADRLGVAATDLNARRQSYQAAFLKHLRVTVAESPDKHLLPGVRHVVETLHANPQMQLGLVTGNVESGARIKLDAFGLNSYFPCGGFGDDGHDRRDIAGAAYARVQREVGAPLPPDRVVVVGDTVNDIIAAKAHRLIGVGVGTGGVALEAMREAGADFVAPDLSGEFLPYLISRLQGVDPPSAP